MYCEICGCNNTEKELKINDNKCFNCNTYIRLFISLKNFATSKNTFINELYEFLYYHSDKFRNLSMDRQGETILKTAKDIIKLENLNFLEV